MERRLVVILGLVIFVSSFASAGLFDWITGRVVESGDVSSFIIEAPFYAGEHIITKDIIAFEVENRGGEDLSDVSLEIIDLNSGSCSGEVVSDWSSSDSIVFEISCTGLSDEVRGNVIIEYNRPGSNIRQKSTGSIFGRVEILEEENKGSFILHAPFYAYSHLITEEGIALEFDNKGGEILTDVTVQIDIVESGSCEKVEFIGKIISYDPVAIEIPCTGLSGKVRGNVIIEYNRPGSNIKQRSTGSILGYVTYPKEVTGHFIMSAPFYGIGSEVRKDLIQLEIDNRGGEELSDVTVQIDIVESGSCSLTEISEKWASYDPIVVNIDCTGLSDEVRGNVIIEYNRPGSNIRQKSTGSVAGRVKDVVLDLPDEGYTIWDQENGLLSVQVKRGTGAWDLMGLKFTFLMDGDGFTYVDHYVTEDDLLGVNEKKVYYIDLSEYSDNAALSLIKISLINEFGEVEDAVDTFDVDEEHWGDLSGLNQEFVKPKDFGDEESEVKNHFIMSAPFYGIGSAINEGLIRLEIQNKGGEDLTDVTVDITDLNSGGCILTKLSDGFENFEKVIVDIVCNDLSKDEVRAEVVVDYSRPGSSLRSRAKGSLVGRITSSNIICRDSDGGKNYYVKGEAFGFIFTDSDEVGTREDQCAQKRFEDGEFVGWNYVESCTENCGISEAFCHESSTYSNSDKTTAVRLEFECPGECRDGACVETEENEEIVLDLPDEGYTIWDQENGLLSVQVKRGTGAWDLMGLKFIFLMGGDFFTSVEYYVEEDLLDVNEEMVYYVDLSEYSDDATLTLIEIAPVGEFGEVGRVADVFHIDEEHFGDLSDVEGNYVKPEDLDEEDGSDVNDACNGCFVDGKCYDMGYRKSGEYCSDERGFVDQVSSGGYCDNSFECESNLCLDSECVSGGFLRRVMNWLRRLIGSE